MASSHRKAIVRAALERAPESHAERLHVNVARNTPAPLYQWLLASLLFSARIASDQALKAAGALFDKGWTTPEKMAATEWEERVKVLNANGYARYDESTARYIADTTDLLRERYDGDLRKLRAEAERDPSREREALKQFKGIGDVGVDIFFREAQLAWDELYPFADWKALRIARDLDLGDSAEELAALVTRKRDLPRLLSALVMEGADGLREAAA